ncbi:hypothetical protein RJ639_032296 [Escallonia herrerae]|uniref:Retrotransposon Copia-like N-terminal domain-containing protein n=1 Tax=Escallonia herrerae TaxID=1293975 RepID=A0AA88WVJ2_9ASTE|nr:hypothetical protein RJ639_032296 [Escallonia herrerae]
MAWWKWLERIWERRVSIHEAVEGGFEVGLEEGLVGTVLVVVVCLLGGDGKDSGGREGVKEAIGGYFCRWEFKLFPREEETGPKNVSRSISTSEHAVHFHCHQNSVVHFNCYSISSFYFPPFSKSVVSIRAAPSPSSVVDGDPPRFPRFVRHEVSGDVMEDESASYVHGGLAPVANVQNIAIDTKYPLYLHPSDHPGLIFVTQPLSENGENYFTWRRNMLTALQSKNKAGFVDGLIAKPDVHSRDFQSWIQCNAVVKSWIVNSLSRELQTGAGHADTASEIWFDFDERFTQGIALRVYDLKRSIALLQ